MRLKINLKKSVESFRMNVLKNLEKESHCNLGCLGYGHSSIFELRKLDSYASSLRN